MTVDLVQTVNQTLFARKPNGAWDPDSQTENTAYGVLTLKAFSTFLSST